MNFEQKIRYSRNISLQEIGEVGQSKLLNSRVCVVGAGGIGAPVLTYLAASGIGNISIIDDDKVDLSNLQRQVLFEVNDIGDYKVNAAKEAIYDLNPDIKVVTYQERLNHANISNIVRNYDIVIDGSDNIETRLLLNDFCYGNKITLISPAIDKFVAHLYVFKAYLGSNYPCYRCIYPNLEKVTMPKCSDSGVLGSIGGVIGAMAVTESVKEILQIDQSMAQNMVIYDALNSSFKKLSISRNKSCELCS